ncbi:hypothetical protein [Sorangium sp. So ce1335]|uniref:hypothetical protein n=1 Tax=Sorangium sp. So ce1335 TaxID=3133335 RepID=UPI003F5DA67D
MNVTSKLDLDGMLNDWPAPALDEAAWEARAARIVEVAVSRRSEDAVAQADLLAAPDLAVEPGEEQAGDTLREVHAAGDSTMADGSQAGRAAKSEASLSSGSTSRPPEKRRQSLKEIAERASQAPGRASGAPGTGGAALSTPLPASGRSALSTPLPASGRSSNPPGRSSLHNSGIRAAPPSLRSAEGVTEDSGVIDLNRLSASVPPEHVEAAGKAQPVAADALDERPAEVAALSARRPRAAIASGADAPAKKRSGGVIAGAALAAVGLAAAVAVLVKTNGAPQQQEIAAAPPPAVTLAAPREEKVVEPAAPVAAAPAAPEASAPAEPPEPAEPATAEKLAAAPRVPAASAGAGAAARTAPEAPAAPAVPNAEPQSKVAAAPTATGKPGDLGSAMQAAVGDDGEKQPSVVSESPVPASGPLRQQNIPEQPSQGSVQAALGAVMGSARSCVAGADDVSRAQITFSSTGQVSKVNVSGWAAANGQSGCVQSALKAANVGPFSKPSFSVNATIRP